MVSNIIEKTRFALYSIMLRKRNVNNKAIPYMSRLYVYTAQYLYVMYRIIFAEHHILLDKMAATDTTSAKISLRCFFKAKLTALIEFICLLQFCLSFSLNLSKFNLVNSVGDCTEIITNTETDLRKRHFHLPKNSSTIECNVPSNS